MVTLDESVRMVGLQFNFTNPTVIPSSVKRLERETPAEQSGRKSRSSGVLVIEPTENCSLAEFLEELEAAGYEMVDAFYKERIDPKDPHGKRTYHMVRFLFVRREHVKGLSDEFKKLRDTIRPELRSVCGAAMWRVRVFLNPFFNNGEEVPGQHAVSINLEARNPLFHPNGQPVMVWQRDESGNRVGDAPLPLKPDHCLRIEGNAIRLMVA